MHAIVSIATHNCSAVTAKCLKCLRRTDLSRGVEIIFSDNASTDDTLRVLENSRISNKRIIRYGYNTGFPYPHNRALDMASGQYFIVLNNDVFIYDKDWLSTLLAPLEDEEVAIVGLEGNPSVLLPNGDGTIGDTLDYVEASCLAGRTELFRRFGLFSPCMKMFCFEDSDLSLRYRQMGYTIQLVSIKYHHERSTTARNTEPQFRDRIVEQNRAVFLQRWSDFLVTRSFRNRILIRAFSAGIGDVLYASPAVKGIRKDHPTAEIDVSTNWPDLFENNPHVNRVFSSATVDPAGYDRVIDFDEVPHQSLETIAKRYERLAATKIDTYRPDLYLTDDEQRAATEILKPLRKKFDLVMVCSFRSHHVDWEGKNWELGHARDLVNHLHLLSNPGVGIVEVGKGVSTTGLADLDLVDKTGIRELIAVIAQADAFIGIDSFPSHVAQAFGLRSWILYGATEPLSYVADFSNTVPIRCDHLPCIGCYQRKGINTYNKCLTGTEACMKELDARMVFEGFLETENRARHNVAYLHRILLDSVEDAASRSLPTHDRFAGMSPCERLLRKILDVGKHFTEYQVDIRDATFVCRGVIASLVRRVRNRHNNKDALPN